jgi:hypothetical protein
LSTAARTRSTFHPGGIDLPFHPGGINLPFHPAAIDE